jgi:hypothetical protein
VWGSTDNNSRGDTLLEFLISSGVSILNRGSAPTFINAIRQEVLDLTLASSFLANFVEDWHVSNEPSLSDHQQIRFNIKTEYRWEESYRVPRRTNWTLYRRRVQTKTNCLSTSIDHVVDLENAVDNLNEILIQSYEESCQPRRRVTNRDTPWWNDKLEALRREVRKLFNTAKRTQEWAQYKEALTKYNLEVRRSKRRSWRNL